MTPKSLERLSKVHPLLAERVKTLAATLATQNINIEVVQGIRTWEEQDRLFAKGRTIPPIGKKHWVTRARGGQSNHNYGLAVDVCPFNKDGEPDWNNLAGFALIGQEGKKLGLGWGGDWKSIVDQPHLELKGLSVDECFHLYKRGGLKAVWDRASELNQGE